VLKETIAEDLLKPDKQTIRPRGAKGIGFEITSPAEILGLEGATVAMSLWDNGFWAIAQPYFRAYRG
jgi:hypothetical protein